MTQREDLETLRKGLLVAFEKADNAVKAQVAGQLRAVIKDLAELGEVVVEGSPADEIAARREARDSGAADKPPAARRGQPRRSSGRHRSG